MIKKIKRMIKMKNIRFSLPILVLCLFAGMFSCNTDKLLELDHPKYLLVEEDVDLGMMFSNIEISYTRRSALNALRIPGGYAKYYATHSLIEPGDRYQYDQAHNDDPWGAYTSEANMAIHLIYILEDINDPEEVNNLAMAKIMKVSIFSWLTDIFGDIPYSQAGMALISGEKAPTYDTQQYIYEDLLSTLKVACASFDITKSGWDNEDVIYNGDITKWEKYGYSLMLRLAMRIANVDPVLAKEYAELAISQGVISDNSDNFQLECIDGRNSERNPFTYGMIYNDPEKYWKLGADFVDALKDNDPRAKIILGGKLKSEMPVPNSGIMNTYWYEDDSWDYTIESALGYPHGQDVQVTSYELIQKNYTAQSRDLFKFDSPVVRMLAHEMYFLVAKAASLGWDTQGKTSENMYNEGITANMKFYGQYTEAYQISDSEIEAYLSSKPYSLQNLSKEMWLANYLDPFQGWFYIRQWGPDFLPNVEGLTMPRRNAYVDAELTRNTENYNNALTQMGIPIGTPQVEQFNYRCWWDVVE